jgi:putative transposase
MATTTVLDFVPVFRRPERAELMTDLLFRSVERYGACLTAFVIMPEHIHLLLRLPPNLDAKSFFNRFKGYSASCMAKELEYSERALFSQQRGLNRRSFWQRSFRSRVLESPLRRQVAVRYIHRNPVKRGLCGPWEDWRWSSAWMHEAGEWDEEMGLRLRCWCEK